MTGYTIATGGGHLEDAVLMQLLDADGDPAAGAREHLTSCTDCSQRYSTLQKAAGVLRASLPDVPMPRIDLPSIERRRAWVIPVPIAIAASIVAIATAAAATPVVRHWIMQHLTPDPAPIVEPTPTTTTTPEVRRASVVASFTPTDSILSIRIERTQASGVLRLLTVAGEKVTAQAEGRTNAEELLVMPSGIRVTNAAGSVADYRVGIPASIKSVRISIAGKETAVVVNDDRLDRRIPLR